MKTILCRCSACLKFRADPITGADSLRNKVITLDFCTCDEDRVKEFKELDTNQMLEPMAEDSAPVELKYNRRFDAEKKPLNPKPMRDPWEGWLTLEDHLEIAREHRQKEFRTVGLFVLGALLAFLITYLISSYL